MLRDVTPVALISRSPLVMEVSASFPAKTVPEFIAYAKAHPGTLNMASAGTGGATHVVRRIVSDDGRHQDAARAVSRLAAGDCRTCWPGA